MSQPHECECRICGQSILFDPAVKKLIGANQDPLYLTDEQIINIAIREADEPDATRVSQLRGDKFVATTILNDSALIRFGRAICAAIADAGRGT